MAETPQKSNEDTTTRSTTLSEGGKPESPTTAQPLDFDDDQDGTATPTKLASTAAIATAAAPTPPAKDEAPPPKPPRPLSPREQAENTLKEAFPTIDAQVIKAVLTASSNQVEPAFNALLGMTDPDAQREPEQAPPTRPPRPTEKATSTQQSQLEADELYARQLHEHYANNARDRERGQQQGPYYNEQLPGSRPGRPGATYPDSPPQWRSFFDDDLPEIRDNISKGFKETQNTVNRWISNWKKSIDGDPEDDEFRSQQPRPAQNVGAQSAFPRRSGEGTRRSVDMARYDADPQVIGDDFSKLELRDGEHPPRTSSRPLANPNLFRPGSNDNRGKSPGSGRKVSFHDGPPEEIQDIYNSPSLAANADRSATPTLDTTSASSTPSGKPSKWQPLNKVDPSPVQENDPFSLGDSDDDAKDAQPIKMEDNGDTADEDDRLKKGLSEATSDAIGNGSSKSDKK